MIFRANDVRKKFAALIIQSVGSVMAMDWAISMTPYPCAVQRPRTDSWSPRNFKIHILHPWQWRFKINGSATLISACLNGTTHNYGGWANTATGRDSPSKPYQQFQFAEWLESPQNQKSAIIFACGTFFGLFLATARKPTTATWFFFVPFCGFSMWAVCDDFLKLVSTADPLFANRNSSAYAFSGTLSRLRARFVGKNPKSTLKSRQGTETFVAVASANSVSSASAEGATTLNKEKLHIPEKAPVLQKLEAAASRKMEKMDGVNGEIFKDNELDEAYDLQQPVTYAEEFSSSGNKHEKLSDQRMEYEKASVGTKDETFQQYLDKGLALLTSAKKGLNEKTEIRIVEDMLYEAADLFSKAAAINPSSLTVMGQWGNTLLVHGQLKLKMSQRLTSLLFSGKVSEFKYESAKATLHDLCEECQSLLAGAGSKYKAALSLDNKDVRSLYNWGLALCLQAQLVAAGGDSKAAKHADKLYLAASNKFEAMMGISQIYAPQALWSWGSAMHDRSRLRPKTNKGRMRLLLEAKKLFQDALKFDPRLTQAEVAMISCAMELDELEEYWLHRD